MSYEKQHWQTYDELKTEEENKALGAVVTSERMNHVEDGIAISHENIDSHIKQFDNPHKVTSEQVGAYTKEESNKKFAELGSSYTKKESENLFITHTEADAKFLEKTDASITYATKSNTYTKQETDKLLSLKADLEDVYTKNESDEKYISKQEFNDGLTKAVGFGTGSDYTVSSSGVVVIPITTSYIDDEIFSVASNKITVKKSGLVAINLSWLIDSKSSSSSWINGELYKNSTPWARINHEVKMRQPGAISNLVLVNSGDTFHFQTNSDNSGYIVRQLRAYILFIKDINEVT
ncbi:hypothetical protein [Enterococcus faecalis]|uniref:hypothetical protein n=1 Tax=Enterococcus faecalis TaxID=1351 RepID=UPI003D275661